MMKISVVVPVYNTSKYLRRCLDSLVNQSLKDIEIIIINDKSTDNSKDIIKEYENKYQNIKVIHNKTNKGIGYNRNLGIEIASGKYIAFVDSDDYIDLNLYQKMHEYSEEEKLDLCICDLKKVDEEGNLIGYEKIEEFETNNLRTNPKLLLDINMGPTNKLFSKTLFDEETKFSEIYKYEDLAVLPKLIAKSKKIGKVSGVFYNYVIHSNSETTTMDKRVFDIFCVLDIVNKDLKNINYYNEIYEYIEYLNIRTIFRYTLQQKYQKEKKVKEQFIENAFTYLDINFPNWRKNKLWHKRNYFKRLIEGNKTLTKLYCLL